MSFEDLSYEELLNINAGDANAWLRVVGEGIFTVGAVMAGGGTLPVSLNIASGFYSISKEFC